MPDAVWAADSPQRLSLQRWSLESGLDLSAELSCHLSPEGRHGSCAPVLSPAYLGRMLVLSNSLPLLLTPLFGTMRKMYGQPYLTPGAAELTLELFTGAYDDGTLLPHSRCKSAHSHSALSHLMN